MRLVLAALATTIVLSFVPSVAHAQSSSTSSSPSAPTISVPRLINLAGVFRPADGQPVGGVETVTFAVYADESGGTPLWQETQQVTPDGSGRYTVLLGATQTEGVPLEVFASGEARWLGMIWTRGDASQARRSRLTFVPYAVHATDADTLGGKPASAYALTSSTNASATDSSTTSAADPVTTNTVLTGVPGQLAKYAANGVDIIGATTVESGGRLGVGTTAPLDYVHAQFTDNSGGFTGFAVQNLSGGAAAFSGTLFYDQLGNLGQFQGFNNSTHEYRINNVAQNGPNYNGTINFMIGGRSRFFVSTGGAIGINVSNPLPVLDISNNGTPFQFTNIQGTTYQTGTFPVIFLGRKARGTATTPTAVQNGDRLAVFEGDGYGSTHFGTGGSMTVRAFEPWTDTAHGAAIDFTTTDVGTTTPNVAMTIMPSGNVGIGTPVPAGPLEIARSSGYAVKFSAYAGSASLLMRKARGGDPTAPTATLVGDQIGAFAMSGYGTTQFGQGSVAIGGYAAESFTDTAQGAGLFLATTPVGTTAPGIIMAITPPGNAVIGPPTFDGNNLPIVPDRLQVVGDIRVGTAGTNGCLKDFSGAGIVGTCSSDLRLKKDITPFGAALDRLTALQPVHYFWRASEFPERHFGDAQAAGLIAQDVEKVLPELVETDKDGFKAVNYSKLPLLTIQAVKELKAENDALKEQHGAEIDALKQRVAELERLLNELRAATVRR